VEESTVQMGDCSRKRNPQSWCPMLFDGRANIWYQESPLEAEQRDCWPEQADVRMKSSSR